MGGGGVGLELVLIRVGGGGGDDIEPIPLCNLEENTLLIKITI